MSKTLIWVSWYWLLLYPCISRFIYQLWQWRGNVKNLWGRDQLKCYGTRAEARFRLSVKRTSPFKSAGASVQSTTGTRGVCISGSNAGHTMFRGSVKGTGYPLHPLDSPSLPLPCVNRVPSHFNRTLLPHYRVPNQVTAWLWRFICMWNLTEKLCWEKNGYRLTFSRFVTWLKA